MTSMSTKTTTWSPPSHSRASTGETPQMSPSSILRSTTASIQKPPLMIVGHPSARDTPGPSPDETDHRKSYAEILNSEAAPTGPLGLPDKAWPPLVSMAPDPPPKTFVRAQDRVPPDIRRHGQKQPPSPVTSPPPCKRRRRRTRRTRNSPPTHPPPIRSYNDMIASLSFIVHTIQMDALHHLCEILTERFRSEMEDLSKSFRSALSKAHEKQWAFIKDIATKQHKMLSALHNTHQRLPPMPPSRFAPIPLQRVHKSHSPDMHFGSNADWDGDAVDDAPYDIVEDPAIGNIFVDDGTPDLSALRDLLHNFDSHDVHVVSDDDQVDCCGALSFEEHSFVSDGDFSLYDVDDGDF